MSSDQTRHPHFIFTIDAIGQSSDWNSRFIEGMWQPPRPLRSNVRLPSPTAGRVYEYHGGNIRRVPTLTGAWQQPEAYSFYYSGGHIYVYPENALNHTVGDGDGNTFRGAGAQANIDTHDNSDCSEDNDARTRDWRSLSFVFPLDGNQTSYACFVGNRPHLGVVREDHLLAMLELLPNVYFGSTQRVPASDQSNGYPSGGLAGKLQILIALIAYSVPPDEVEDTLIGSFGRQYIPHGGWRTAGWIDGRGLLVRISRPAGPGGRGPSRTTASPQDILKTFEEGRLPGYGKFVR